MIIKILNKENKKILTTSLFCAALFITLFSLPFFASASTNISSATNQHWAWNDVVGWIDFYMGGTSNITVNASNLTYSASSSVGLISLDCNTAPSWNCSPYSYGVTNDGTGNLGGWAWNNTIGWISFYWGNPTSNPNSTSTKTSLCTSYGSQCGVYIDSGGNFNGFAWSDTVGWISFTCSGILIGGVPLCNTSPYSVVSSWAPTPKIGILDSTTFDTSSTGAQLNSIIWHGSLNGLLSGAVGFQLAASNSTTSWTFTGPGGTTSTSDVYSGDPDVPIPIYNYATYSGYRYFRYRIILETDSAESASPEVTGVSIDWSP